MSLAFVRNNRFSLLLIMLMLLLVIVPSMLEVTRLINTRISHWIVLAVTALLLASAVFAISGRPIITGITLLLMISSMIIEVISDELPSKELAVILHVIRVTFFGFIIFEMLRILFQPRVVTMETISASLCVYLLIGALWANFYAIFEIVTPGSIVPTGNHVENGGTSFSDMPLTFRMLYFSLITLSTVGYGDVVPVNPTTRMLAACEAIIGQIYLLVMVSRLVGIQVAQALTEPSKPSPESPDRATS